MIEPSARRAAKELKVPANADGTAARAAFLKRLPADEFLPPETSIAALHRLNGSPLPLTPQARDHLHFYEQRDLKQFLAKFWSLTPVDRNKRWQSLHARCTSEQVARWLTHLQPALDDNVPEPADPADVELLLLARELLLLTPRKRAARRAEWLAANSDIGRWRDAILRLGAGNQSTAYVLGQVLHLMPIPDPNDVNEYRAERPDRHNTVMINSTTFDQLQMATMIISPVHSVPPISEAEVMRHKKKSQRAAARRLKKVLDEQAIAQKPALYRFLHIIGCYGQFVLLIVLYCTIAALLSNMEGWITRPASVAPPPNSMPKSSQYSPEMIEEFKQYNPLSGQPSPPGYWTWRKQQEVIDNTKPPEPRQP